MFRWASMKRSMRWVHHFFRFFHWKINFFVFQKHCRELEEVVNDRVFSSLSKSAQPTLRQCSGEPQWKDQCGEYIIFFDFRVKKLIFLFFRIIAGGWNWLWTIEFWNLYRNRLNQLSGNVQVSLNEKINAVSTSFFSIFSLKNQFFCFSETLPGVGRGCKR